MTGRDRAEAPQAAIDDTAPVRTALRRMGLLHGDAATLAPLTGGVASDIWRVTAEGRRFVVKRALARLRVAADWRAPVGRNAMEVAWLRVAAGIVPDAVPEVLGHDPESGLFAMTWLPPEDFPVWKARLLAGHADAAFAARVGATLGAIHAATWRDAALAARFATDATFRAIRLDPYLGASAARHPAAAPVLDALARRTAETRLALVHGDVSPKNILCGPRGPVLLDAECAWFGDPAFDLAFCLTHLLLKCVARRDAAGGFVASFAALAEAHGAAIPPAERAALAARAATLLPALLLARVDGKSPVEYLTDPADQALVRDTALALLATPPESLAAIGAAWLRAVTGAA